MNCKVLIIEDDEIMRVTIEDALTGQGFEAAACENGGEGIEVFDGDKFSLVITDVRLPDMTGLDVMKRIKEKAEHCPVIIMTAYGTIKDAVEAIKLGAFDYITKPFALEEFIIIVKRALEIRELKEENLRLKRDLSDCYSYPNIVGESEKIMELFGLVDKVSQTDSAVLITGESGTGKELIATTIHYQSRRRNSPLIKVNCAAFPEHLVESELFGYEKGAFTGAVRTKPGRFERADKGTIFLDEIGDLPLSVQTKLLRVLQDGSFERLGGTGTMTVDVRVISASNRDIEADIKSGRFREDLYYRLNVIPLRLPPLRERRDDIPLLIDYFLDIYNCRFGKRIKMQPEAIAVLMDYKFPGNVRELENIIERCVTLSNGDTVSVTDLPSHLVKSDRKPLYGIRLDEVSAQAEKDHIKKILVSTKGNKTRAAEILGISRKSLWEKLKQFELNRSNEKGDVY